MLRQYKLDLMARFMEIKAMNPKITQNENAKGLGYSSATVKRYRNDVDLPSPYKLQSNTNKRKQKFSNDISNNEHEPNVNSNEPKRAQKDLIIAKTDKKSNRRNRNILKAASVHEDFEINEHFLDKILHKNEI